MFGGSNVDKFLGVAQTSDNGYIVVGESQSNDGDVAGMLNGGKDAIIVKYDSEGNVEWNKNFGGTGWDEFWDVTQTTDGKFVAVGKRGTNNAMIVKYDATGDLVWNKYFGGSELDRFRTVKQTNDGGFIVAGDSRSNDGDLAGLNNGNSDGIIVKYDSEGNVEWNKNFGSNSWDGFKGLDITTDGKYVAAGEANNLAVLVQYDTAGNVEWYTEFGGSSYEEFWDVKQTLDGGFVAAGVASSTDGDLAEHHGDEYYAFIVKFDSNGNFE